MDKFLFSIWEGPEGRWPVAISQTYSRNLAPDNVDDEAAWDGHIGVLDPFLETEQRGRDGRILLPESLHSDTLNRHKLFAHRRDLFLSLASGVHLSAFPWNLHVNPHESALL